MSAPSLSDESDSSVILPSDSDTDSTPAATPVKKDPPSSRKGAATTSSTNVTMSVAGSTHASGPSFAAGAAQLPATTIASKFGKSNFDSDVSDDDSLPAQATATTPAATTTATRLTSKYGNRKFGDSDESESDNEMSAKQPGHSVAAIGKAAKDSTRASAAGGGEAADDLVMSFDDDFDDSFLDAMG